MDTELNPDDKELGYEPSVGRQNQLGTIRGELHDDTNDYLFQAIDYIQGLVYSTASANGWHDEERNKGEVCMLLVTEVAELYEDIRNGVSPDLSFVPDMPMDKPVGIDSELADILIRVMDTAAEWGVDLALALKTKMIYNTHRSYRHGGKTA